MTDYMVKVFVLEQSIYSNNYYVELWEQAKNERDITQTGDEELCTMLNDFWDILPDSMSIHREPFNALCDLCEGTSVLGPTSLDMILSSGIHTIEFTKKNGEYRKMQATRDINIIRQHLPDCEDEDLEPAYVGDTSLVVFDLEKKDWRRFMVENLIEII